jgi:hypothetical protein
MAPFERSMRQLCGPRCATEFVVPGNKSEGNKAGNPCDKKVPPAAESEFADWRVVLDQRSAIISSFARGEISQLFLGRRLGETIETRLFIR